MELVRPSAVFEESFVKAMDEEVALSGSMRGDGTDGEVIRRNFVEYVRRLLSRERGENLPEGYVPDTIFWLVDKGEYIGRASLRHRLNNHLLNIGGHIGYDIRPSMRRKGFGTAILALMLAEAKKFGLSKVLLTCDATNEGSRRIIEKNGGILEDARPNPDGGPDKLRFWIALS